MSAAALQFDAVSHEYSSSGRVLQSVTQILKARGLVEGTEWFTEESRERGRAVHTAIHLECEGDLDPESLDPRILGFVTAYRAFVAETRFDSLCSELALGSERYNYAGTLDRLGWLHDSPEPTLVDFKSGSYARAMALQLEAYALLLEENAENLGIKPVELPRRVLICELMRNGRYRLHDPALMKPSTPRRRARALWMSALALSTLMNE